MKNKPFRFAGYEINPGTSMDVKIKVTEIYMSTSIHIPVHVINGVSPGAVVTVMSAVHGDELNGIEIIRQLHKKIEPRRLSGTLILVAIANPISFIMQERDLPDGKDLNRAFPGSPSGTISSILANKIFRNIIEPSQFIIDLHTAGGSRSNLPYLRVNAGNRNSARLAFLFGAEFVFDSVPVAGMLRRCAERHGKGAVTYEAGEPMRFHPDAIRYGIEKVQNVLRGLKMYDFPRSSPRFQFVIKAQKWLKARKGGILIVTRKPGEIVREGDVLAFTTELYNDRTYDILSPYDGIVVGVSTKPHAIAGEGVCHVFHIDKKKEIVIKSFFEDGIVKL